MNKKLMFVFFVLLPAILMADEPPREASIIGTIFENAGFAGWSTIILSVGAFTIVFKLLLVDLKQDKIMPAMVITNVEQSLGEQDYEGAFQSVQGDPSFLGKVLDGGLSKMNFGHEAVEKGAEDAWITEQTSLMQSASYVQLIAQVAPMLGLFGTVYGMMQAFAVLALTAGAADPKALAGGIMNALVTTFIGLLVAIPCNMAYLFIRNKIVTIGLDVANMSSEIMDGLRDDSEEEE